MILDDIVANKKSELAARPKLRFRKMLETPGIGLVCELKMKSPTHPESFGVEPSEVFRDYKKAGVDAISVVTDSKYFGGNVEFVRQAQITNLPVLRKDFILESRQITEVEADALLLIARILSPDQLKQFVDLCLELDIEPVVEIHDESELVAVLDSGAKVVAVNSRDLQAQKIDIGAGLELLDMIPEDRLTMFFSGIDKPTDLQRIQKHRINGVLIGTSILIADNRVSKIRELREVL